MRILRELTKVSVPRLRGPICHEQYTFKLGAFIIQNIIKRIVLHVFWSTGSISLARPIALFVKRSLGEGDPA